MATKPVIAAAERLQAHIDQAKASNNWRNGWYAHMAPWDIEAVVAYILAPAESAAQPEPEPPRMVKVTARGADGAVVWEGEVLADDFTTQEQPDGRTVVTFPAALAGFTGGTLNPDGTYTTGAGQTITNVHDAACCAGRPCVIHAPSNHHMRAWPTYYRDGGPFDIKGPHMERTCPHGVGHPDPDDLAFHAARGQDYGVHGCDGCCRSKEVGSVIVTG